MTAGYEAFDHEALAEALVAIEEIDDLEGWAGRFALLSDPTRLRLLFCLHRTGGLCVSDLAEAVGMSVSSVSHALRLMRERGWVRARRRGRTVVYHLVDETVHELLHSIGAGHSPHPAASADRDAGAATGPGRPAHSD
jgi:DNA-binding transcriptional ArsR family regulator